MGERLAFLLDGVPEAEPPPAIGELWGADGAADPSQPLRIAGDASKLVFDRRSRRCPHPKERARRLRERGGPREPETR